jgi:hypothetical protein
MTITLILYRVYNILKYLLFDKYHSLTQLLPTEQTAVSSHIVSAVSMRNHCSEWIY